MSWTPQQKRVVLSSFLGWTLDAFDFFILVFVLKDIAKEFSTPVSHVAIAITLTLAMRPVGALLFGRLADRFGRRPLMMINIAAYSILEFASGFAPSLFILLVLRALFGIAMGGEWGIGSALAMESVAPRTRGLVSGILQVGYPTGYLLASLVFGLFYQDIGWRGLLMVGVLPALLVLYIRHYMPESEVWQAMRSKPKQSLGSVLKREWKLALYAIILMTAFNFLAHGTQDLYPTFLEVQHTFSTHTVSFIAIAYNIAAIAGGLLLGFSSEKLGRRRTIFIAALLVLPLMPLWAFSTTAFMLMLGAVLMQFMVQGAWGVIPAYLNELSPSEVRATFPGLVYQLGNLLAAVNATLQAGLAQHTGGNYSYGLALVVGIAAIVISSMILFGPERRGTSL
jgi:SHS family lactate transporter-like MFS transporter